MIHQEHMDDATFSLKRPTNFLYVHDMQLFIKLWLCVTGKIFSSNLLSDLNEP